MQAWYQKAAPKFETKISKSLIHPFVVKGKDNGLTINPYQGCQQRDISFIIFRTIIFASADVVAERAITGEPTGLVDTIRRAQRIPARSGISPKARRRPDSRPTTRSSIRNAVLGMGPGRLFPGGSGPQSADRRLGAARLRHGAVQPQDAAAQRRAEVASRRQCRWRVHPICHRGWRADRGRAVHLLGHAWKVALGRRHERRGRRCAGLRVADSRRHAVPRVRQLHSGVEPQLGGHGHQHRGCSRRRLPVPGVARIAPYSRLTIDVRSNLFPWWSAEAAALNGHSYSAYVASFPGYPSIVVEHALYRQRDGTNYWRAGFRLVRIPRPLSIRRPGRQRSRPTHAVRAFFGFPPQPAAGPSPEAYTGRRVMTMKFLPTTLAAFALLALAVSPARADVQLTIQDGRVTLVAENATARQILSEWARVGQAKIVGAERLSGPPLTLHLTDVPEAQALQTILRAASGYVVAQRATVVPAASRYDRILIVPRARHPRRHRRSRPAWVAAT